MTCSLSAGECAQLACVLEATARKPGNVSRLADFEDCSYLDFLLSAQAIAGPMDRARERGVGRTVLDAVLATRRFTESNTNLGMILLFAPLAVAFEREPFRQEVVSLLDRLTLEDAHHVYEAIRHARPGGLGTVPEQDLNAEPTVTLAGAMRLASARDAIARQYVNGYAEVFERVLPRLCEGLERLAAGDGDCLELPEAVSAVPDTLDARSRGDAVGVRLPSLRRPFFAQAGPDPPNARGRSRILTAGSAETATRGTPARPPTSSPPACSSRSAMAQSPCRSRGLTGTARDDRHPHEHPEVPGSRLLSASPRTSSSSARGISSRSTAISASASTAITTGSPWRLKTYWTRTSTFLISSFCAISRRAWSMRWTIGCCFPRTVR